MPSHILSLLFPPLFPQGDSQTALFIAIEKKILKLVVMLLVHRASINLKDVRSFLCHVCALHIAVKTISLLLQYYSHYTTTVALFFTILPSLY